MTELKQLKQNASFAVFKIKKNNQIIRFFFLKLLSPVCFGKKRDKENEVSVC